MPTTICVYRKAVAPVLREFAPQLVLVSAGFDAHESDPLASMRMTAAGYGLIVRQLVESTPGGNMALVSEGGYDLTALAACLDQAFAGVVGVPAVHPPAHEGGRALRGERALTAVRKAQQPFWQGL